MLCHRCLLRRINRRTLTATSSPRTRPLSSTTLSASSSTDKTPLSPNAATTATNPQRDPPAATSTAAAQPFSSKDTLSPKTLGVSSTPDSHKKPRVPSSVLAGTPLKGLNYFKNKEDPVAMEDDEYPSWLWSALEPKKKRGGAGEERSVDPRIFSKSAGTRRAANKRAKRLAMERDEGEGGLNVPIYEQSVDLPAEGPAREELTKGMREKRRKDIKEANFLKGMG